MVGGSRVGLNGGTVVKPMRGRQATGRNEGQKPARRPSTTLRAPPKITRFQPYLHGAGEGGATNPYALIAADGRQYKVEEGQEIQVDLRDDVEGGATITFDQV